MEDIRCVRFQSSDKRFHLGILSSFHTSHKYLSMSKKAVVLLYCQGLNGRKGKTKPRVKGSWLELHQKELSNGRFRTRSATLYNCLLHNTVNNLGMINKCNESFHLFLAIRNCSIANCPAAGGGVQTKCPFLYFGICIPTLFCV